LPGELRCSRPCLFTRTQAQSLRVETRSWAGSSGSCGRFRIAKQQDWRIWQESSAQALIIPDGRCSSSGGCGGIGFCATLKRPNGFCPFRATPVAGFGLGSISWRWHRMSADSGMNGLRSTPPNKHPKDANAREDARNCQLKRSNVRNSGLLSPHQDSIVQPLDGVIRKVIADQRVISEIWISEDKIYRLIIYF
jgi:hypothetical protein